MQEYELPYLLIRGGTSKGPLFLGESFPDDVHARNDILISLMGSKSQSQVDGIGGGSPLSNKVCLLYPSNRAGIDIEYLLCQVHVNKSIVDCSIDCGNMLSAVACGAIHFGFVQADANETNVHIFSRNTGKTINACVQTPNHLITYDGDEKIDGVDGTGAPITLSYEDPAGSSTGQLFPTGQCIDTVDGIEISCVDASMPMIIVAAESLGKTGYETKAELDSDQALMQKLDRLRKAGIVRMHLPLDDDKALAKICMVSRPQKNGNICARYFISPKDNDCHPTFAVTGAICLAAACCTPNTIAHRYARLSKQNNDQAITIEHPLGEIRATVKLKQNKIAAIEYKRTARLIARGEVYVRTHRCMRLNASNSEKNQKQHARFFVSTNKPLKRSASHNDFKREAIHAINSEDYESAMYYIAEAKKASRQKRKHASPRKA